MDSHISLMEKECEIKFFDLNTTFERKLTLKPKDDVPELVMISEPVLTSFHFNEIELDCECDTDLQFVIQFYFLNLC